MGIHAYETAADGSDYDETAVNEIAEALGRITNTGLYPVRTASYIIFQVSSTYYALNGTTGKIDDSNATLLTLVQAINDSLTAGTGGTIYLSEVEEPGATLDDDVLIIEYYQGKQKTYSNLGQQTLPFGTAFPASANEGDEFYRTDLKQKFHYTNSLWCQQVHSEGVELSLADFQLRAGTYRTFNVIGDYMVLDFHPAYPIADGQEEYMSAFSWNKLFGYGTYQWTAYEERNGTGTRITMFGGFERQHGLPTKGIATIWRDANGDYWAWSRNETDQESTQITLGVPWTSDTVFKIERSDSVVKFYVDGTLRATHSTYIPPEYMSFFIEVGHNDHTDAPTGRTYLYYKWKTFTKVA